MGVELRKDTVANADLRYAIRTSTFTTVDTRRPLYNTISRRL